MIDLDQPVAEPTTRRPRWALGALALALAGGVLGGMAVDRWHAQRAADDRRSAVSLVALPDLLQRPDDGVRPAASVDGLTTAVDLTGHVTVVNAGPAPVRFVGFRADQTGLQVRGEPWPGPDLTVPAGGSTAGTIHATIQCDIDDPLTGTVPTVFEVVTADGVRRRPTVRLDARAWAETVEQACAQPWSRSLAGRGP
jgi:hypothetical protein